MEQYSWKRPETSLFKGGLKKLARTIIKKILPSLLEQSFHDRRNRLAIKITTNLDLAVVLEVKGVLSMESIDMYIHRP